MNGVSGMECGAFVCVDCGSSRVIAVAPGCEPEVAPGGFVVSTGTELRAWCVEHAPFLRRVAA